MDKVEIWRVILEATNETIKRTRRTLVLIIGLTCVTLVHLYMWYASWDLARIAGRRTVVAKLAEGRKVNKPVTISFKDDEELAKKLEVEIAELEKERGNSRFEPPLLGFSIGINDFGVIIQMLGVAVLLWLVFNQKRLNFCLRKLEPESGWELPRSLLELHFGLVGSHADRLMKFLGRLLPLSLPFMSFLLLLSDLYDLKLIQRNPWQRLAFEGFEYRWRVFFRLGSGAMLGICVFTLGLWSYREWKQTEENLTKFSNEENLTKLPG